MTWKRTQAADDVALSNIIKRLKREERKGEKEKKRG
jgi:hypothetical protein